MNNNKKHITPPKLAERFLLWFLKGDLAEEVLGDLDEKFYQTLENHSKSRAKRNYWYQVLKYIRPFALKRNQSPRSNLTVMFKHNLLISFRSFKRYKSTFLINLFGLATGLASALLIYLWVNDELNMNQFEEKDSNRHFQVFVNTDDLTGVRTREMAPTPLAKAMEAEFPEVEYGIPVISANYYQGVLSFGDQHLRAQPIFVGDGYLNVFQCDFVSGNKEEAFSDKNNIVISEKLATGLFEEASLAIGQTVDFKGEHFTGPYLVSGVFSSSAEVSLQPDIILSYDQFLTGRPEMTKWYNGGTQTHLVLNEGVGLDEFNGKIKDYLKTKLNNTRQVLFAQQYSDKYLFGKYENGFPTAGRMVYVRIFSLIGIVILLIACINYMNLSTAQASRRVKEIGIKKAIGAQRKALIYQYFGESIFMCSLSLLLAIGLILLVLPGFNDITGKALSIDEASGVLIPTLAITVLTGLISGIYPGLYLSGFKPVFALKGKIEAGFGGLWLRKGLVVFQFAISVTLITSVIIIYQQINFIQTSSLGYNTDHLISFRQEGKLMEDHEAFITEAKNVPGVLNISYMWGDLGGQISGRYNLRWAGQDPDERKIEFHFIEGGYGMASLIGVELMAGRFLSRENPMDNLAIVVNEAVAKLIGHENPVGEKIKMGDTYTIVGLVKNFHFQGMQEEIQPFFFMLDTDGSTFMAKIQGSNQSETIHRIQELHDSINPGYPFEFKFIDENYQQLYEEEERVATLSKYFSAIAIAISCLGLLALTAFSTQRRFKEIAIRKVLGSSGFGIVRLLSGNFIGLILLAILVGLPTGYYLMKNWLDGFAYRISLDPVYFLVAGALMLLIAWFTIMAQTAKSAKVNITESLRGE